MADRIPLIFNPDANQLQELAVGDNLDLTQSGIVSATNVNVLGIMTAASFSGTLTGSLNAGIATATNLNITGVATLPGVQISTGIVTSSTGGIVTYYGDGSQLTGISAGGGGDGSFDVGITSTVQLFPVGYSTAVFTFPATSGKIYIINSINAANVGIFSDATPYSEAEINLTTNIDYSTGYNDITIGNNLPIAFRGSIELIKKPLVLNPSDVIKMYTLNNEYVGVSSVAEVYMSYSEVTSSTYFGVGVGTTALSTTNATGIFTSTTYPSVLASVRVSNESDSGDHGVSVSITNGSVTSYLVKNLIVPRYSSIELCDKTKRIEAGGVLKVELETAGTMSVVVSGRKITG